MGSDRIESASNAFDYTAQLTDAPSRRSGATAIWEMTLNQRLPQP
jgi:hypothetical protein